jgi:hypothetical protein
LVEDRFNSVKETLSGLIGFQFVEFVDADQYPLVWSFLASNDTVQESSVIIDNVRQRSLAF